MNPITMKLVVDDLILQALREDITFEDVSTASVCPTARPATVELIAKADGIIAGLQVLRTMVERGQNLATCCEGMTLMPQVLINIRYQGQHDPLASDAVRQAMAQAEAVFAGQGRILLRKSGTEPLLRIMAEGENETQVRAMAEQIAASIRAVTGWGNDALLRH